jgi:hypothetical protein
VNIFYKCQCLDKEQEIAVPDRRPTGDLIAWMNAVQTCIGMDHEALSPKCRRAALEYAKIPMIDPAAQIGVKPVIN